jgi:hypothetical protein
MYQSKLPIFVCGTYSGFHVCVSRSVNFDFHD